MKQIFLELASFFVAGCLLGWAVRLAEPLVATWLASGS